MMRWLFRSLPDAESGMDYAEFIYPRPPAVPATIWQRLGIALRRLEDSWLGDLIGVLCLLFTGYLLFLFAWGLS